MADAFVVLADPKADEWAGDLERAAGIPVLAAQTAEAALDRVHEGGDAVECIVTAAVLEGERDGASLTATLHDRAPEVPVIFFGETEPDGTLPAPVNAVLSAPTAPARRSLVTLHVERKDDLTERNAERVDPVCTLDERGRFTYVNEPFAENFGYEAVELEGAEWETLADDDRDSKELLARISETGHAWHGEVATRRRDGTPLRADGSLRRTADGGVVATVREVSRRPAEANALQALGEIAESLATVDRPSEVCRIVADTIATLDGGPSVALYLYDDETRALTPVATGGQLFDDPPSVQLGDENPVTEAFFSNEAILDTEAVASLCTGDATAGKAVAMGDRGVCVAAENGFHTESSLELAGPFARTATAAFDRIEAREQLDAAEQRLDTLSERADHLSNVTTLLRDVTTRIVRSRTREELEQRVCEALVSFDEFVFVWVGVADQADELTVRTWAGPEEGYLDSMGFDDNEPSARTAASGELTVVSDVGADIQGAEWRRAALSRGLHSVASVPLTYRNIDHGILTLYAEVADAFDGAMEPILVDLGEAIGHSLTALETRRALLSDRITSLELEFEQPDTVLFQLAEQSGARLVYDGFVPTDDDGLFVYCSVPTDRTDAVEAAAASLVGIDAVEAVSGDDETALYELRVSGRTISMVVGDFGVVVRSADADPPTLTTTVELPHEFDVREFMQYASEHFTPPSLLARRTVDRPTRTKREFRAALEEQLTEKQLQTLLQAYERGYFEWPRETTGKEIAESLGVTQPTVNRHLRASERKLFEMLFGN
ncbi:bacterio-opsin activator domain-containing protein [Haloarchaeobius sp. TZWWS8]|uniref:bacterio-opsin activator domain-containing protein n=1 Tax=Haloarchaeobius sp. TZWWS8 TaxID=3446121 RepID=UPI003EBA9069